jgi:alginate O-acetyltransferase complex protein AlgI
MTFTGTPFLILILVTYPLWHLCRGRYWARVGVLLTASLVFYAHDEWPLLFLLMAYGLVDWAMAGWIVRARRPRIPLVLGLSFNLAGLAVWKYAPLVAETAQLLGLQAPHTGAGTVPFGISFYSFTGIAYLVDVYRRKQPAEPNALRCLLHVAFFPHLMAGPILRASEFLTTLRPGYLPARAQTPREAALLLARGYFKKMVLADRIALAADPFFAHVGEPATAGVWALPYLYLYAFQIYFDFSGYTDIARGLALLFGFRWPENFNVPYLADSPREFWRRWHMTLSRFLRDYVYIPLGGNRRGPARTLVNVMITMLLGGLWHGGSWSFAIWGGLHGVYLVLQRLWGASRMRRAAEPWFALPGAWRRAARVALTFNLVCLTWSFFRLPRLASSVACLRACFAFEPDKLWVGGVGDPSLWVLLGTYGLVALAAHELMRTGLATTVSHPYAPRFGRGFAWGVAAAGLGLSILLAPSGQAPPFIYFQF